MTPLLGQRPRAERAFERLYDRHAGDVYRYSLALLRNPTDAEDVTQTTFLNAYRAFRNGERPESPRAWLIAIAHNVCRQRFRTAQRRVEEVAFEETIAEASVPDPESPGAEEIRQALSHLAFNQRAALVMRELEGRSYAEIGEALELSTSAVETLLFRARRALREQLEGGLSCREAELAISRQLDGRLGRRERGGLRAHLRQCEECAGLARRQRAQRSAIRALGLAPLPSSLASWLSGAGAGGAAAAGTLGAGGAAAGGAAAGGTLVGGGLVGGTVALKAAALLAVGSVAAVGVGREVVHRPPATGAATAAGAAVAPGSRQATADSGRALKPSAAAGAAAGRARTPPRAQGTVATRGGTAGAGSGDRGRRVGAGRDVAPGAVAAAAAKARPVQVQVQARPAEARPAQARPVQARRAVATPPAAARAAVPKRRATPASASSTRPFRAAARAAAAAAQRARSKAQARREAPPARPGASGTPGQGKGRAPRDR